MLLGVLLAAGTGSRFEGDHKLLATVDGDPIVARAARNLTGSSLDRVVAVVGNERERVERALPDGVEALANPDYESGQASSVRRGVAAAREHGADAALFALGDMPDVRAATVDALVAAYRDGADVVVPRYDGRRGNPVLFDARHFDALAAVSGDRGGRDLLESEPVTRVDVDDPGVRRDVDTLADLRAVQDEFESEDSGSGDDSDPGRG